MNWRFPFTFFLETLNDTSTLWTLLYRVIAGCLFFGILGDNRHGASGQSNGSRSVKDTDTLVYRGKISPEGAWLVILYFLVLSLLWGMYFVGFTVACGQTPGKRILGLHVVDENGAPVDWDAASIRFLIGYPVSLLPLGLGFYWALVDKNNQAWHDKIAGTLVIGPATS